MRTELAAPHNRGVCCTHGLLMLTAAVALTAAGCGLLFPVERVEQSRVASPDGRVEAVVLRTNAGATTSYGYQVHLVPAGTAPEEKAELLRADGISPGELRVDWAGPRMLRISLGDARIFHYKNFWMSADLDEYEYVVKVRLEQAYAPASPSAGKPDTLAAIAR